MERELETMQVQLSQAEQALAADPGSTELASLCSELNELIALTKASIAAEQAEKVASSSRAEAKKRTNQTPAQTWSAGDDCLAKYSGDGGWYQARITSVGGSTENRVYSIVFKNYNTTELIKASDLKPLPANYVAPAPPASNKRKLTKAEEEEKDRKKKKNEKKVEMKAAKAKEQNSKQETWQKFAKKAERKGEVDYIILALFRRTVYGRGSYCWDSGHQYI